MKRNIGKADLYFNILCNAHPKQTYITSLVFRKPQRERKTGIQAAL
jgi:hypothetical protein